MVKKPNGRATAPQLPNRLEQFPTNLNERTEFLRTTDSEDYVPKIQDLCQKALATPEGPELDAVLRDLKSTLTQQIRQQALESFSDRRKNEH